METRIYPDSSLIVSLLCSDGNSEKAMAWVKRCEEPLLFTPLHRLEVRNALRNLEGRGLIAADERKTAFRQLEEDIKEGYFTHASFDWSKACRRADVLSEKHFSKNGQRTIDLLHVAIAMECQAKIFMTFDQRQGKLAEAVGFESP